MPRLSAVLSAVLLAACAPSEAPAGADARAARAGSAVVADISPGTNPYHVAFRRPGWDAPPCRSIPGIPCNLPVLDLTLGEDYSASLRADLERGVWAAYRPGTVHWVRGTNLLLLTRRSFEPYIAGVADGYGGPGALHGVGTAAAASAACPDCYILVVQDAESVDGAPVQYIADALPWVDVVVSTNLADFGDAAQRNLREHRYARATRALVDSGRLFFSAAGNFPVSVMPAASQYQVPPWVVSVGGAHEYNAAHFFYPQLPTGCYGVEATSAKPMDFAGQYAQALPESESTDGYLLMSGTSFAAPQTAGAFAQTLADLRARLGDRREAGAYWRGPAQPRGPLADGRLTAAELRETGEAAARYFAPGEFEEGCMPTAQLQVQFYEPVAASPTPWFDMGWGFFGPGEVPHALALLLGEAAPAKAATAQYQQAIMAARAAAAPHMP